jgi:uncharacterized cupredoxin-like copper-binding protein
VPNNPRDCGLSLQDATGVRRILSHGKTFLRNPQWSPDGKRIAYDMGTDDGGQLRIVNADGSADRLVLKEPSTHDLGIGFHGWSWMRDGAHLVLSGGDNGARLLVVDAADGSISSDVNVYPSQRWYPLGPIAASPTADRVAVTYYREARGGQPAQLGIALVDPDGSNFQPLVTVPDGSDESFEAVAWAPDGRRIVYTHAVLDRSVNKRTSRAEWIEATPGAKPFVLFDYPKGDQEGAAYTESVLWSPAGDWIVFSTVRGMTVRYEAVRPTGADRLPFAAVLGGIDWQPCHRGPAECTSIVPGRGHAPATKAATTIQVKASEFRFKFSKSVLPKPGTVTFVVKNVGHVVHDLKIGGKKTPLIKPGETASLAVTFRKTGKYAYLCTVSGHAAAGMKGVFTVR